MKSLMSLVQLMLRDASIWCCVSTTRDLETITRRVEHEGLSFLTITLPTFSAGFERCLADGRWDSNLFPAFSRGRGPLPKFLSGLVGAVFDSKSGLLLDEPSILSIFFIRQITLLCKKVLIPCSESREKGAIDGYIKCEQDLKRWVSHPDHSALLERFGLVSDRIWGTVLSDVDRKVYVREHVPRHGPGATADRLRGNLKYDQAVWHSRLEENHFPSELFLIPNQGFFEELEPIEFFEPEAEMPVKVITVPKTLKTPRIIAVEPTCMQYAQQSILELLVDAIEKNDFLQGSIGFTDQLPNQELARLSSIDGGLATIDLSEASDRVSNSLVMRMLKPFPHLDSAVQACRSLTANVPGYGIIPLTKFASMGSALCFPIEAMVFLTIICIGLERELNRSLTESDIKSFLSKVRVYGDDIIVPVDFASSVLDALQDYGLVVNRRKTFVSGNFRESCGKDYFRGVDLTCVYVRKLLPSARSSHSEMISTISLRNQLYKAGCWETARYLDNIIERLAPFPTVAETSPVLGKWSYLPLQYEKICPTLHRPIVKGLVVKSKAPVSVLTGPGALLKFFLKRGLDPFFDKKHLERYGRPRSVDTKIEWASLY
jgi:hypothetical protein